MKKLSTKTFFLKQMNTVWHCNKSNVYKSLGLCGAIFASFQLGKYAKYKALFPVVLTDSNKTEAVD